MIDLHIHTTYSDGADSLMEVLEKAEQKKLEYISITDHDNCNAYMELKNINVKKYYNGNVQDFKKFLFYNGGIHIIMEI